MSFFKKIIAQVNKLNPTAKLAEDATEAEVLDALEQIPDAETIESYQNDLASVNESLSTLTTSLEEVTGRLTTLESAAPAENLVTTENVTELIGTANETLVERLTATETTLKGITQEIANFKTVSSTNVPKPDGSGIKPEEKPDENSDPNVMKIDMDEVMASSSPLSGLGIAGL